MGIENNVKPREWFVRYPPNAFETPQDVEETRKFYEGETGFKVELVHTSDEYKFIIHPDVPIKQ